MSVAAERHGGLRSRAPLEGNSFLVRRTIEPENDSKGHWTSAGPRKCAEIWELTP